MTPELPFVRYSRDYIAPLNTACPYRTQRTFLTHSLSSSRQSLLPFVRKRRLQDDVSQYQVLPIPRFHDSATWSDSETKLSRAAACM